MILQNDAGRRCYLETLGPKVSNNSNNGHNDNLAVTVVTVVPTCGYIPGHVTARLLDALEGVIEPETKRKIIGSLFIEVFQEKVTDQPVIHVT